MSAMPALALPHAPSCGGRLVTPDGRALPFLGGTVDVDACAGLARVVLRQTFHNPHAEPLRVTYQVPLPADAATSGYAFEVDGERVVGRVEGREAARERFEEALMEGRTAALLEEDRSSLFTQEVGNIPPGAEVVCELILDQPLRWVRGWEWRFPTVVAPRFLGAGGRVADAERVVVDVAEEGGPSVALNMTVRDARTGPIESPSHALSVHGDGVVLADESAALDRDIVVRWPVAAQAPGASLDVARPGDVLGLTAYGLLTLVPPRVVQAPLPRDLIVLLDTSGSMGGRPLDQAKAVVAALIDTLGPQDTLELVEFSNRPRRWKRKPAKVTPKVAAAARSWVSGLRASGGTQMRAGIVEALAGVRRESRRQVLLVTDGLIGFEKEIVAEIRDRLPAGSRVHTLGIGSSTNRTLLRYAARAGGGAEMIVGLDESPEEAAEALVAATDAPVIVDLEVSGSALLEAACARPADLMGGRPTRMAVSLKASGGELVLTGRGVDGAWSERIAVPPVRAGAGSEAVTKLFGRERVEELELDAATGSNQDAAIEAVGIEFQIATRRTSWVAVGAVAVDPSLPTRSEGVPQALPHGLSAQGLGLRPASSTIPAMFGASLAMRAPAPMAPSGPPRAGRSRQAPKKRKGLAMRRLFRSESVFEGDGGAGGGGADEEIADLFEAVPEPIAVGGPIGGDLDDDGVLSVGSARIVLARRSTVAFELTFEVDYAWERPATVVLHLDGRSITVEVRQAPTTGSGTVLAGAVVRLVVRGPDLHDLADAIRSIELPTRAGALEVPVTGRRA